MVMRTGLLLCLALVCWSPSLAVADGPVPADAEARFQALLADAKEHPEKADWKALRLAFTKTKAYQPYSTGEPIDKAPVEQELKNGERAAALHALDRVLEGHWVDPSVHEYAAEVCERIDEPARARLHETFMTRILDTIFGAGDDRRDGRSFEEAWPVLSIREEYLILEALDLKDGDQAFIERDGHFYDVHTFNDPTTSRPLVIYFNVDLPRQWLREHDPDDRESKSNQAHPGFRKDEAARPDGRPTIGESPPRSNRERCRSRPGAVSWRPRLIDVSARLVKGGGGATRDGNERLPGAGFGGGERSRLARAV